MQLRIQSEDGQKVYEINFPHGGQKSFSSLRSLPILTRSLVFAAGFWGVATVAVVFHLAPSADMLVKCQKSEQLSR